MRQLIQYSHLNQVIPLSKAIVILVNQRLNPQLSPLASLNSSSQRLNPQLNPLVSLNSSSHPLNLKQVKLLKLRSHQLIINRLSKILQNNRYLLHLLPSSSSRTSNMLRKSLRSLRDLSLHLTHLLASERFRLFSLA